MDGYRENCIEWITGENTITLSISQKKFIKKVEALCKKHSDKAKIITYNNDGSILAKLPLKALKLSIIEKELTDEQREEMAEKAKKRFHGGN